MDSFALRYAFWVAVAIVAGVTPTTAVAGVENGGAEAGSGLPWSVGEINGEPRNEYAPLAENEFRRRTADGEVVTIRSATDLPQVIRAGQSFVVHLGNIPAENLVLRLAMTARCTKLISQGASSHDFYVWTDDSESRKVVLELNGFMAIYNQDDEGRKYCDSRAAIRFSESGDRMLMLVEGEPGEPATHLLRLEDPAHIKKAVVSHPKGYSGVKLRHRRAAQIIELRLPPLPAKEDGLSVADTKDLFSDFRPREDKSRVVIGLILTR